MFFSPFPSIFTYPIIVNQTVASGEIIFIHRFIFVVTHFLLMANSSSNTNNNSTTTSTTTTTAPTTPTTTTTTTVGSVGQKLGASSISSIRMVSLAATIPSFKSTLSESRSVSLGGHQKTATVKTSTTITTRTTASGLATTKLSATTRTTAKASAKLSAATTPTASHMENGYKTRPTFVAASLPVNILTQSKS